jgi:CIC family chloride channel protein
LTPYYLRRFIIDARYAFKRAVTKATVDNDFVKWVPISVTIGVVCGVSALVLIYAIDYFTLNLLGGIAGYLPPTAGGEGSSSGYNLTVLRPYLIPFVTALGGLIGGLLVHFLAPEAQGVGTEAAIRAFHEERAVIRTRIPPLKLLTSAITIGSGGASGREGPIAQIGAGVGSFIATLLKMGKRAREIALASGLGAGIAAIFKAPLAGAIIGAEIFYKHDFEVEALIPGFIASVVGYSIVGYATGWQPIFATHTNPTGFGNALSLPLYSVLGVLCAGAALLLFRVYFTISAKFKELHLPIYLKTTIGGFATGLIGLMVPSVLGTGYGWAQLALDQNYTIFPPLMILIAIFAEIFALSFTLGSGGSGGIFGPSVVTGGLLGALMGYIFKLLFPTIAANPSDFAIVGMVAFFAASAKAPVSTIVMIAEMTGGYGLLAPAMFAVAPAFILSGNQSVFPSQVHTREDSPAHAEEYESLVLQHTPVSRVMSKNILTVRSDLDLEAAEKLMLKNSIAGLPVINPEGNLVGIITEHDALNVNKSLRHRFAVRNAMSGDVITIKPDESCYTALKIMTKMEIGRLPVVSRDDPKKLVGIITRSDIGAVIAGKHED